MTRVLVATHNAYWNRSMGSQQRIHAVIRYLVEQGHDVFVYYTSSAKIDYGGAVVPVFTPNDFIPRRSKGIRTYHRCIGWVKQSRELVERVLRKTRKQAKYRTWHDFMSEIERAAFLKLVDKKKPQVILVEYIWLTRLISNLPRRVRNSTKLILDTHDVMYERTRAFISQGRDLEDGADEADEAEALQHFDLVLAIQSEEAKKFTRLCPDLDVLTVPHAVDVVEAGNPSTGTSRLLYVGSDNGPNADGLRGFIESVWPRLSSECENTVLDVVGTVCRTIDSHETLPSVEFHGRVDNLLPYYERAAVVIAPVPYASGLNIKVVEALGYGKPVVTLPRGSEGMEDGVGSAFLVAADWDEFGVFCKRLIGNAKERNDLGNAALAYATRHFSPRAAFDELGRRIARAGGDKRALNR